MDPLRPSEPAGGPVPRSPCSAYLRAGKLLFVSGPIDMAPGGSSLAHADLEMQTRQCMAHLRGVLEAGGASA